MNAEQDYVITDLDRYNLVQSDHQVNCILSQCRFPPCKSFMQVDPDAVQNDFQRDFIVESSCMVCKEVPMNAKECYNCNKIICFLCELKQTFENGHRVPNKECFNCKVSEQIKISTSSNNSGSVHSKTPSGTPLSGNSFSNNGPVEIIQPVYQKVSNKLLKQMMGQIKVKHRCSPETMEQTVMLEDLEKHIEIKCHGFVIECFCCAAKIRSYQGIQKHLKYNCPKLKINCQFCTNWFSREDFKNKDVHPCQDDFEIMLDKFQGNVNKLIEEDESESQYEESKENDVETLERRLKVLERKNEILMGKAPNLAQLSLMINLIKIQKGKSFIDKKTCLNEACAAQYHRFMPNYFSEVKIQLFKPDSELSVVCKWCKNSRYCSIFECRHCESKFCYYCLIDASKKQLLQSLKVESQMNIMKPTAVLVNPPVRVTDDEEEQIEPEAYPNPSDDLLHNEKVIQNFGKYRDQFVEFMSWRFPSTFFTHQEQWIKNHQAIPDFDYIEYSSQSPKIHTPDRLELELVNIRKQQNYIYEGQVLVNTQSFHGFGRMLQYVGGVDSGHAYVYEGWFINGLPEGVGRKVSQDGTVYTGKFRFGLENGEGVKIRKTEGEVETQRITESGEFAFGIFSKGNN